MRKLILIFVMIPFLSACSFLDEVNKTLEYVNQAKDHISLLSDFGREAPQLIKDAAANPDIKTELENQLVTLKAEIEQFNNIDAPLIAKDIHQQLVNKNESIIETIDMAMENGEFALDKLENTEIFTLINDVTTLLDQIEALGQ